MVLEFVKSQRGKPKLKHQGYLYCLLREKDGLKTWRCDKRQRKAIATTFEDNVLPTREDLHEADTKHLEQLKVLEKMKEKAANSNEQPRKIVQDATATITRECAVALPKYKNLAWSIQRQRGFGNNPTTLKDVAIPSELQLTLRAENFLAHDSGYVDRERFPFFALSKICISSNTLPNGTQTERLNAVQFCSINCIQFIGFAHQTTTKTLQYLWKEQSLIENRIARIRPREISPVNAKLERHHQRLQQLLNHYQNNILLSVLEGLSI